MCTAKIIIVVASFMVTYNYCHIQKLSPNQLIEIIKMAKEFNETVEDLQLAILNFTHINVPKSEISFLLFTTSNGNKSLSVDVKNCTKIMNVKAPTKVIIPAWLNNPSTEWVQLMVANYQKKANYNLIVIDWSTFSSKSYIRAAFASKSIGSTVGDFIVEISHKMPPNFLANLHVIGFSLAGQIAGFVGKRVAELLGGKQIGRLTGLDVSGPLFETPIPRPEEDRLAVTDAAFLDLIHTQLFFRGLICAYGDIDFYVNPGQIIQNGCHRDLPDINGAISCSHHKVKFFFIQTILKPTLYEALACNNTDDFRVGKCDDNEKVFMGDSVRRNARGKYYINVDGRGQPLHPEE